MRAVRVAKDQQGPMAAPARRRAAAPRPLRNRLLGQRGSAARFPRLGLLGRCGQPPGSPVTRTPGKSGVLFPCRTTASPFGLWEMREARASMGNIKESLSCCVTFGTTVT